MAHRHTLRRALGHITHRAANAAAFVLGGAAELPDRSILAIGHLSQAGALAVLACLDDVVAFGSRRVDDEREAFRRTGVQRDADPRAVARIEHCGPGLALEIPGNLHPRVSENEPTTHSGVAVGERECPRLF